MKKIVYFMLTSSIVQGQVAMPNKESARAETITFCRFADGQAIVRDIDTLQYLQLRNGGYNLVVRQRDTHGQILAARIISNEPNAPKNLLIINQQTLVLYFKNGSAKDYQRCEP